MRFVFLVVLLIGLACGFLYPWGLRNFSGHDLGTWRVYDRTAGFKPVEAKLEWSDAPVRVLVDLTVLGTFNQSQKSTVLTLTAATAGHTVMAETMTFIDATERKESPQNPERILRAEAGVLSKLDSGDYTFTVAQGDMDEIQMRAVDLILRGGVGDYDERVQPFGFVLSAIGFIGLVISMRRGKGRPKNPNSQPPPPKWGRGGA